jgi:REP element-mobilizing transposase RayT
MTDNPAIHRRHSIRLRGYDYSQAGAYYITICTHNRECLFGRIVDGEMKMNDAGRMIQTVWDEIPLRFGGLELDEFTVMPNHIHGIIVLHRRRGESCIRPCSCIRPGSFPPTGHSTDHKEEGDHRGDHQGDHRGDHQGDHKGDHRGDHQGDHKEGDHKDRPYGTLPGTVGRIIQAFKSITTHEYTGGVKKSGWPPFPGKLWQRNYWEHIVRNETELNRISKYIHDNPAQWERDGLYSRPAGRLDETCEPIADYDIEAWMP